MPKLPGTIERGALEHGGRTRTWIAYLPARAATHPALVIALHSSMGTGERARASFGYDFDLLADQHGFIAVYPQGYEGHWNDCKVKGPYAAKRENIDDVGFLHVLVDRLVKDHDADPARVYVAGISKGQPVSVLFMNGTADPINPWQGGDVVLWPVLGNRGRVLSAQASVDYFRKLAGLEGVPQVTQFPDRDPGDGSTAERSLWSAPGKHRVALYTIKGGGHAVPHPATHGWRLLGNSNRDIHAANEIWGFFQSVP